MNHRNLHVGLASGLVALSIFGCPLTARADAPLSAKETGDAAACQARGADNVKRAASASPDARAEAGERFKKGVQFYDSDDFKLALIEFERVYELVPNYSVLYNIGEVNLQLNNYARALTALEEYLCEGGDQIAPARKAEVQRDIKSLRTRTATVVFATRFSEKDGPGGALSDVEISVDESPIARSGDKGVLVDAGVHRIVGRKRGYRDAVVTLTLAGRDEKQISLVLEKEASVVVAPPSTPMGIYLAWGGTAVLGTATGLVGLLALNSASDLASARNDSKTSPEERQGKAKTTTTLAVTTDVLGVVTIVAAAVSLYFTLTVNKQPKPVQPKTGFRFSPTGAGLSGSF